MQDSKNVLVLNYLQRKWSIIYRALARTYKYNLKGMELNFYRVIDVEDFDNYYKLKADPPAIIWSGFRGKPDSIGLKNHFEKILVDKNNYLFFLKDSSSQSVIGYIQFERFSNDEATYTGTSIYSDYHGKGYGKLITKMMIEKAMNEGIKRLSGYCAFDNIASVKNLTSVGFVKTNHPTKFVFVPGLEREIEFSFYEKLL